MDSLVDWWAPTCPYHYSVITGKLTLKAEYGGFPGCVYLSTGIQRTLEWLYIPTVAGSPFNRVLEDPLTLFKMVCCLTINPDDDYKIV